MSDARMVLKKLGYKMKSRERDCPPTRGELERLVERFSAVLRARPLSIHMPKVMLFALFSTRRQEEIVRICWSDLDEANQRVMVRDMKNPGDKWGNDVWCYLPDEAWAIVQSMPKTYDEIFPYTTDAIQGAWARAVKALQIEDLHFHDLRHEFSQHCRRCSKPAPPPAGRRFRGPTNGRVRFLSGGAGWLDSKEQELLEKESQLIEMKMNIRNKVIKALIRTHQAIRGAVAQPIHDVDKCGEPAAGL